MAGEGWQQVIAFDDAAECRTPAHELYHENSKVTRHTPLPDMPYVRSRMATLDEMLAYDGYPKVALPAALRLDLSVTEAIQRRATARSLEGMDIPLALVATLLSSAYGRTHDLTASGFPRYFRAVPSGGALYPLELYFHTARTSGLAPGLYHYRPTDHSVRHLRYGDESRRLAQCLVQAELAMNAAMIVFITAVFERSTMKYGERGYRFALIEAGHVGQNLALASVALGVGCVNIGGFVDREVDRLLDLDGLRHSAVYLAAIGSPGVADAPARPGAEA